VSEGGVGDKKKRPWFLRPFWLVVLVILAAVGAWLLLNRPWEVRPLAVAVEAVTPGPASRILAVNGRITPSRQVEISSTVNGRVKSVEVDEGDEAAEGATLLIVDDAQQRAAVAQVDSAIEGVRARLQQAKIDYERAKELGDSISRKTLDDALLAVETAQKEVDQLIASRDQAMSLLAEYVVRAPFDGTVLVRGADPGQVVGSSSALFSFAALAELNAEASVDELYSAEIKRGIKVTARPSGHATLLEGTVAYVSPVVDTSTGGRLVRVDLPEAASLDLPVGLTVTLNIVVDERSEAITVPRSAILTGTGAPAVLVVDGDTAARREIEFVDWPSDRVIVTSGLSGGEQLIIDPSKVAAGDLVAAEATADAL